MLDTLPVSSPYQQLTSEQIPLLETLYLSPDRYDTSSKYAEGQGLYAEGLGPYEYYQSALPIGLPPSPQWSGSWIAGVSSLMTGAFYDSASHFPLSWNTTHPFSTSSLSSTTCEMPYDGLKSIEVEYFGWVAPKAVPSQPLAVAFEAGKYTLDEQYGTLYMPNQETSAYLYRSRNFERARSRGSDESQHSKAPLKFFTTVPRQTRRRQTDSSIAAYCCSICAKGGFVNQYNLSRHELTHDPSRRRDHPCQLCSSKLSLSTDLMRHNASVHLKSKDFTCSICCRTFSRRDAQRR